MRTDFQCPTRNDERLQRSEKAISGTPARSIGGKRQPTFHPQQRLPSSSHLILTQNLDQKKEETQSESESGSGVYKHKYGQSKYLTAEPK